MDPDQFDDLIRALEPGLLDWISGVGVPVFLGVATLVVAIWAGRMAKRATEQQQRQHDELQALDRRRRRALFVHELALMTGRITAARIAGIDAMKAMVDELEHMQALRKVQVEADEPTARTLATWASHTARNSPLPPEDFDAWLATTNRLAEIGDLWIEDPKAATSEIVNDPNFGLV